MAISLSFGPNLRINPGAPVIMRLGLGANVALQILLVVAQKPHRRRIFPTWLTEVAPTIIP